MKKDWFKDWFESDFYQKVYNHRDNEDEKLICDLIINSIELQKGSKILDAACGSGRHYLKFLEYGFNVYGFDLSKNLLSIAQQKSIEKKFPINLFCADIRKICLKEKFDLITNLFTSFGYFENDDENFSFIRKAYELLKINGYYVLDYFNMDYLINNLIPYSEKQIDSFNVIENRVIENNRVNKKIVIQDINTSMVINEFYESVKLYKPDELIFRILNMGFKLKHKYGNYLGDSFDNNKSQRLILVFQK